MKLLLVSLFHPELVRGGAQQVCYELFKELQTREGIEPTLLAAIDPSFKSLYKSGAQITGFDGREGEFIYLSRDYDYTWHKGSNPELTQSYVEFLALIEPDVVHFHHFHLFGVDMLTLTRRTLPDARIVFTFHEFMSICDADGHMVRKSDKSLCSKATPVRCHQCFPNRPPEHFFVREMWFKRHLSVIDEYTVPSRFMIERYVSWGLDPRKITHVTNGQPDYSRGHAAFDERAKRNRFGFFGQLVDSKGILVLLKAAQQLRQEGFTDFVIEINGDNLKYATQPCREEFEAFFLVEEHLPVSERIVVFNGSYSVDQLAFRMARVDWCIVPSTWWEIYGLVISEAWMFRRPVIASNVGGPRERITHGKDGLLFEVADASSLAQTIRRACSEKGLWQQLVNGITPPATARDMANAYLGLYKRGPRERPGTSAKATNRLI